MEKRRITRQAKEERNGIKRAGIKGRIKIKRKRKTTALKIGLKNWS